ncbi:MAG: hypothetical protein A2045_11050 [Rhodocyclales bacterium GWA2_65_20]|nr:MAG: hypothetical protein A2045_11050 [Rhodocyclales bacterium GWA2_65_20]
MMQMSSFTGWNIADTGGSGAVWRIYEGQTYPLLTGFLTPLTLADVTATYNGATQSGTTTALAGILGAAASGRDAGLHSAGYYSTQQGYDIAGGNLTISPATLYYTATPASRLYGEANPIFTGTVTGFKLSDTLAAIATGTAAFDSTATSTTAVGSYAIDGSGLTLATTNYLLTQATANATALTITAAPPAAATTTTSTVTEAVAATIQAVLSPSTTDTAGTSPTTTTATTTTTTTTASTDSGSTTSTITEENTTAAPAAKPVIQTITVGNTTVQKPANEVLKVERPRGRALTCRAG